MQSLAQVFQLFTRTSAAQDLPTQLAVTQGDAQVTRYSEETTNKQVTFRDPVRNSESDYQDPEGNHNERETSANWNSGNAPYTTALDDPSSSYAHYLPPVLEEPSSSFSEGHYLFCTLFIGLIIESCHFKNLVYCNMQLQMMTHYQL